MSGDVLTSIARIAIKMLHSNSMTFGENEKEDESRTIGGGSSDEEEQSRRATYSIKNNHI